MAAIGQAPRCARAAPAGATTLLSRLATRVPNGLQAPKRDAPRSGLGDSPGGSVSGELAGRVAGVGVGGAEPEGALLLG